MTISLSKNLLPPKNATKLEKLKIMKTRQSALSKVALKTLTNQDYKLGESLKIPGTFAFKASHGTKRTSVGIKTSADRWLGVPRDGGGTWGVLSRVEEVFVVTFDDREKPRRLQVYAFDPRVIIDMAERVYAEAGRRGQTGIQWIPLDDHADRNGTSTIAGSLGKRGRIILDEVIEWTSAESDEEPQFKVIDENRLSANWDAGQGPNDLVKFTIAQAKLGLAAQYGVSVDSIKIIIEG